MTLQILWLTIIVGVFGGRIVWQLDQILAELRKTNNVKPISEFEELQKSLWEKRMQR